MPIIVHGTKSDASPGWSVLTRSICIFTSLWNRRPLNGLLRPDQIACAYKRPAEGKLYQSPSVQIARFEKVLRLARRFHGQS